MLRQILTKFESGVIGGDMDAHSDQSNSPQYIEGSRWGPALSEVLPYS